MNLRKFLQALLALVAFQSMAFANSDQDEFFKAVETLSPDAATVLRDLGEVYREKCHAEPTVEQYKTIGRSSTAYTFRMVMASMGSLDTQQWSPEATERYQEYLREMECIPEQAAPAGTAE